MNIFFGICIFMLFCYWVWQLKQQNASLRGQLPEEEPLAVATPVTHAMARAPAPSSQRSHFFGPPDPRPKTHVRVNGVPTWFIAEPNGAGTEEKQQVAMRH